MLLIFAFCTILMTDLSPHCLQIRRFTTPSLVVKVQFYFLHQFHRSVITYISKNKQRCVFSIVFSKSLSINLNLANKLILLTYIQKNLAGGKKNVKFNHVSIRIFKEFYLLVQIYSAKKTHEFSIWRNFLLSLTQLNHIHIMSHTYICL